MFATDEDSDTVLVLHSGRIGGRAAGESVAFREWYRDNGGEWVRYISPAGGEEWAFLVAELYPNRFLGRLESFVVAVASFKASRKEDDLQQASTDDLWALAAQAPERPRTSTAASVQYVRDRAVAALARRRARGKCDLCGRRAPFTTPRNEPFLESHHIEWLAHGGVDRVENTVALCPNCHRKMHIVADPTDVKRLLRRARRGARRP